jgi:hypothetical protein
MRRRTLFVAVMAVGLLVVTAPVASAAMPMKGTTTWLPGDVEFWTDSICPFPVEVTAVGSMNSTWYIDNNDNLVKELDKVVEQDTFMANGKTLTGPAYRNNVQLVWDRDGNLVKYVVTGAEETVTLPDGSRFMSKGRLDILAHPDATWFIAPDTGHSGNVAGFCAALAP